MIALVTDSNAQLPASLRDRYDVEVVPLTIVIDGIGYLEGVEITTSDMYDALRRGARVSTASPSPGSFETAYRHAAEAGSDAVLSIHVGSTLSATVNAARLAALESPVPVDIVDTGTASFAIGCCVWAAGEALSSDRDLATAAALARRVAARVGNVFVVQTLELARRGGRLRNDVEVPAGLPVLVLEDGEVRSVGEVASAEEAVERMASYVEGWTDRHSQLRVGVGAADADDLERQLVSALERSERVEEVVRYEVGPSVVVHTGLGTAGAVFYEV